MNRLTAQPDGAAFENRAAQCTGLASQWREGLTRRNNEVMFERVRSKVVHAGHEVVTRIPTENFETAGSNQGRIEGAINRIRLLQQEWTAHLFCNFTS